MYRRWPSAKSVSKARELLPDPLKPVMTMRRLRGRLRSKFFRLLCRTPRRRMTELADGFDIEGESNCEAVSVNKGPRISGHAARIHGLICPAHSTSNPVARQP